MNAIIMAEVTADNEIQTCARRGCPNPVPNPRPNQIYCSSDCRMQNWLELHPRVPAHPSIKGYKSPPKRKPSRERKEKPKAVTIGEKQDIKVGIDIVKGCRFINKDSDEFFDGAVKVSGITAWLDRYAAASSDPLGALVAIRKRLPDFVGLVTLRAMQNPSDKSELPAGPQR